VGDEEQPAMSDDAAPVISMNATDGVYRIICRYFLALAREGRESHLRQAGARLQFARALADRQVEKVRRYDGVVDARR
jgi:hypothetical protein